MRELLSAAGRAFLRAFAASLIVFGPGISTAPSLSAMYLLGVSAIIGAFAAGLRAIQGYIVMLAAAVHLGQPYGEWLDAFLQGFVGSLIVTLPPISNAPNLSAARGLLVAALVGAFTAALRAVQGVLTAGEHPAPGSGVKPPPHS